MALHPINKLKFGSVQVFSILACLFLFLCLKMGHRMTSHRKEFTDPSRLAVVSDEYMHLAIKVRDLGRPSNSHLRKKLRAMLSSVIGNSRSGRPIHFVMMTDAIGILVISDTLESISEEFPEVEYVVEFVDINLLTTMIKEWASPFRDYFNNHGARYVITRYVNGKERTMMFINGDRYNDDMYLLGAFYHRFFTNLPRIVILDVDMKFMVDPALLYKEFDNFQKENVIGVAQDQTASYYTQLLKYIKKRPGTKVGTPGRFQGVNIGVLMLDLDGIRASDTYEYLLSRDGVEEMVYKYDFTIGQLGDQDWFTMVSIEAEELVYPLSCRFNRQIHDGDSAGFTADLFEEYNKCDGDMYVLHGNSGASIQWYEARRDIARYRERLKKEREEKLKALYSNS